MDVVQLIIVVAVFACIVWALDWAVGRFGMPPPVRWIVGAIIIVILLLFLLKTTGLYIPR